MPVDFISLYLKNYNLAISDLTKYLLQRQRYALLFEIIFHLKTREDIELWNVIIRLNIGIRHRKFWGFQPLTAEWSSFHEAESHVRGQDFLSICGSISRANSYYLPTLSSEQHALPLRRLGPITSRWRANELMSIRQRKDFCLSFHCRTPIVGSKLQF